LHPLESAALARRTPRADDRTRNRGSRHLHRPPAGYWTVRSELLPASTPCTAPVAPTFAYFSVGANTLGFVIHVNGETLDANPKIVHGFIRATQK
jgi:hypothetical protein